MMIALLLLAALAVATQSASLECPDDYYFTNSQCIYKQSIFNPETCPLSTNYPPPTGRATCQMGSEHMWYIHVGGSRTDWTKGTPAFCLSVTSQPTSWDFVNRCQYQRTQVDCEQMLRWAGCLQQAQFSAFSLAETETCPDGYYSSNSKCFIKHSTSSPDSCPLSTSHPPPSGRGTCQEGSTQMWYIHVGGTRTDWTKGTSAICLDVDSRPSVWDFVNRCQYQRSQTECQQMLQWAGCTDPIEFQLFGIIENQPRIGTCEHIGQFMHDPYNRCQFYQCVYADGSATSLMPQATSCQPGTTVPDTYTGQGEPCTGPDLPCLGALSK